MHCVGASGHVGKVALGESAEFVGTACFPLGALGAGAESFALGWVSSVRVDGLVGKVDGLSGCIKPIEVISCELQRWVFQGGTGGWVQVVVAGPESLVGKLVGWWCLLQKVVDVVDRLLCGCQESSAASATARSV